MMSDPEYTHRSPLRFISKTSTSMCLTSPNGDLSPLHDELKELIAESEKLTARLRELDEQKTRILGIIEQAELLDGAEKPEPPQEEG